MTSKRPRWWAILFAFFVGVCLGVLSVWLIVLRPVDRLLNQGTELAALLSKLEAGALTPSQLVKRISERIGTDVRYSPEFPNIAVLEPETGILGQGGRWIVNMELSADKKVVKATTEFQPAGWP